MSQGLRREVVLAMAGWKQKGGHAAADLLKLAMAGVLCFWIGMLMLRSTRVWTGFIASLTTWLTTDLYGDSVSWLLLLDGPVFVFMLLCTLVLQLKPDRVPKPLRKSRRPRVGVWSYPVFTRGPLGIVSLGELIGLLLFLAVLGFIFGSYIHVEWSSITPQMLQTMSLWQARLNAAGFLSGALGYTAMAFLFFPVSRGSVLLRFINVPFEHAVKYHKWVAVMVMAILTAHGMVFVVLWRSQHQLGRQITMWNRTGVNNLSGVISLLAGILIVVTSLSPVRNRFFELFYVSHHLYIVFLVFAMMHTGDSHFYVLTGGVFLFALDRFLRFMQSRRSVDLLAVRKLPGGTMELSFAKHRGIQYTAASFIFLQLPRLARFEWHPFTLASSCLAEPDRISILVKRAGAWTQGLERMVDDAVLKSAAEEDKKLSCPFGFKAAIEGPYGHQSSYFLKYDAIMFVAGGSGISPFISILKDLLYRHHNEQPDLPTDVTLIWAVRKSDELHALDTMTVPAHTEKFGLRLHTIAYVTREKTSNLEDMESVPLENMEQVFNSKASPDPLVAEVGRDSNWAGVAVLAASVVGFLLIWGFVGQFYVNHGNNKNSYPSWAQGLFSLLSMSLGITIFGGATSLLWSSWLYSTGHRARPASKLHLVKDATDYFPVSEVQSARSPFPVQQERLLKRHSIHSGYRPDLKEIFSDTAKRLAGSHVGVMVCGPQEMQQSVAYHCQANSSLFGGPVAFHFHCVSFEL